MGGSLAMHKPYQPGINPALDKYMNSLRSSGMTWSDQNIERSIRSFLVAEGEPFRDIFKLDEDFFQRQGTKLTQFIKELEKVYKNH